jgi:hypothetical protein
MARRMAGNGFDEQWRAVVTCTWLGQPQYSQYSGAILKDTGQSWTAILGPYAKRSTAKGAATKDAGWRKRENAAAVRNGQPEPWEIDIKIQRAKLNWEDA